jgi:hypothetical protein
VAITGDFVNSPGTKQPYELVAHEVALLGRHEAQVSLAFCLYESNMLDLSVAKETSQPRLSQNDSASEMSSSLELSPLASEVPGSRYCYCLL